MVNEWVEKRVSEIAPLQRGFDLPTSQIEQGEFPIVYSNGIGESHKYAMAKGPGVVTGRSGTIGSLTFVEKDYYPHNTTLWVTNFNGNDERFIYYLYHLIDWQRYATGSGVPTLNRNDVHGLRLTLPTDKTEQHAIAAALSDADAYITALEKLIAKKRAVKKGTMQELLTGKRRLPDFDGEWVEKCEIFGFHKGVQCKALETGNYPHYNGGKTNSNYSDDYNYQDKIIISEGGNSCGYVNYIDGKFWAGGHCYIIDENGFNKLYLYNLLKLYELKIMGLRVGSGLPNVQNKGLRELSFWHTIDTAEQTAIATNLSDMDAEIDTLTSKLEKVRYIKQGMMSELLTGRIRLIKEE